MDKNMPREFALKVMCGARDIYSESRTSLPMRYENEQSALRRQMRRWRWHCGDISISELQKAAYELVVIVLPKEKKTTLPANKFWLITRNILSAAIPADCICIDCSGSEQT